MGSVAHTAVLRFVLDPEDEGAVAAFIFTVADVILRRGIMRIKETEMLAATTAVTPHAGSERARIDTLVLSIFEQIKAEVSEAFGEEYAQ